MASDKQGHRRRNRFRVIPLAPIPGTGRQRPAVEGIERQPRARTAPALPPNERALELLAYLGDEPIGATELARRAGMGKSGITATLYALADRGLAERVPFKGWRRP